MQCISPGSGKCREVITSFLRIRWIFGCEAGAKYGLRHGIGNEIAHLFSDFVSNFT